MASVSDARAFIRRREAPLPAVPPRTAHTLYWDWPDGLDEGEGSRSSSNQFTSAVPLSYGGGCCSPQSVALVNL
jgi:hypothetical protein